MPASPPQPVFRAMEARVGKAHLGKRLRRQVSNDFVRSSSVSLRIYWENLEPAYIGLRWFLRSLGLLKTGIRNALNVRVEERPVFFEHLPEAFRGFRMLQLSDLHLDGMADGGTRLRQALKGVFFDACVITGDFRFQTVGEHETALRRMENLMEVLQCEHGVFAVLGNHDFIEMVPQLEAMGMQVLLNESAVLSRGSQCIWLAGVDDPHFYAVQDLRKALTGIPSTDFKILLAHSPDLMEDAAHWGVDYYLCGHTHGGQICLPGGKPILTNAMCAKRYVSGSWNFMHMAGHTSRGTGSSGLFVRFFCPPEATLHRLV